MATGDPNVVQISMNLLDITVTPLHVVFEAVQSQAAAESPSSRARSSGCSHSTRSSRRPGAHVKAKQLEAAQIVEARLLQALSGAEPPGA